MLNAQTLGNTRYLVVRNDKLRLRITAKRTIMTNLDLEKFPETAKFLEWYAQERRKGLVDLKFFSKDADAATIESFFSEVNAALHGEQVPDAELF